MPAISSTFRPGEPPLADLLLRVHTGLIQLPDFQRSWVWDDDHIRSLLASVSLSYPIGAVMLLETGGDGVRFRKRPLEGVSLPGPVDPRFLILDGQQRMTSLYLALRAGKPVPTKTSKGQEIKRIYYLDIARCLNPDLDRLEAVVSVPEDRRITSDFGRRVDLDVTTIEKEHQAGLFPLAIVFDTSEYNEWRRGYMRMYRQDEAKLDQFDAFESQVIQRFQQYRVPTIELLEGTPKEAVCQVFEKVNTGGVALTVFELVTATFAADDYQLRDDWQHRFERLREYEPIAELEATDFLTSLTLLATYKRNLSSGTTVNCRRKDILRLTLDDYKANADQLEQGLMNAAKFLTREKVFDTKNLPYQAQLIPLGAICAVLGPRFEQDLVRRKLARWYWSGVFGELYGGANEGRFSFDLPEVIAWIDGGSDDPRTIRDSNFAPVRLLSLQTRLSAAYKGLMVLLMQVGSQDFISGDPMELTTYFDLQVDIHHIFPRAYCERQQLPRAKWNSVVNKAPITGRSNRTIGGRAPSDYLSAIMKNNVSPQRLDEILVSHRIEPAILKADDFDKFIWDRALKLLDLIERATGKQVSGRDSAEAIQAFGQALMPTNAEIS